MAKIIIKYDECYGVAAHSFKVSNDFAEHLTYALKELIEDTCTDEWQYRYGDDE